MNKAYVIWHLQEAAEELTRTVAALQADPDYDEPELRVAMAHLYHHLNTAWNARNATAAQVDLSHVSILLGHASIKITERHYAPWVKARQEQLESEVQRIWAGVQGPA